MSVETNNYDFPQNSSDLHLLLSKCLAPETTARPEPSLAAAQPSARNNAKHKISVFFPSGSG